MGITPTQQLPGFRIMPRFAGVTVKPVAVVDDFENKSVDIDGDSVPDLTHGDTFVRIARGVAREHNLRLRVTPFHVDLDENNPDSLAVRRQMTANFTAIAARLAKSPHAFAAVGTAIGSDIPYEQIQSPQGTPSEKTLAQYADSILNWAANTSPARFDVLRAMDSTLWKAPLYVAAGNAGDRAFNIYTLLQGLYTVGAKNAIGKKVRYSPRHDYVTRYAQGTIGITRVRGGFDITGDGEADVRPSEVSGGENIVKRFAGKKIYDVYLSERDRDRIQSELRGGKRLHETNIAYERLFTPEQLGIDRDKSTLRRTGPEFVALVKHVEADGRVWSGIKAGFTVDWKTNTVVYDPDESGRPDQINALWGTSFATPRALAEDLAKGTANVPVPG